MGWGGGNRGHGRKATAEGGRHAQLPEAAPGGEWWQGLCRPVLGGLGTHGSPSSVTSASGLAKGWPRLRVPNIPDCWHPHWAVGKSPCLDFRSPVCPPPTRTPAAPPQPGTAGGVSQAKTDSSVGTRLCIQKFPELSQGCEPEKWALGLLWPRTGHVGKDIPPWCPAVDGNDGSLGSSSHRPGRRGCPTRRGAPRPGLGPEVSAGP